MRNSNKFYNPPPPPGHQECSRYVFVRITFPLIELISHIRAHHYHLHCKHRQMFLYVPFQINVGVNYCSTRSEECKSLVKLFDNVAIPIGACSSSTTPLRRRKRSTGAVFMVYFGQVISVERGSSVVECRTRNQVSPGSNPALLPCRRLGIFVLSIDAPVDSAV